MIQTIKDQEQDSLIQQNAADIRRNAEAIQRQTEALEKIRDHYYPKPTLGKRIVTWFLKVVGALTIAAGILESAEWYLNVREATAMAEESASVGRRLFYRENDAAGAVRLLEKAVELDGGTVRHRIECAQIKGFAILSKLFDLGRPLTSEEREQVDLILADATYLQEVAPREALPHVLMAQAYLLRGETDAARAASDRSLALAPDFFQVYVTACAVRFSVGDIPGARRYLAEAEKRDSTCALVLYWKAFFALTIDHDVKTSIALLDQLLANAPRLVAAHILKGSAQMASQPCDLTAARASFMRALTYQPNATRAMVMLAQTHLREGHRNVAKLWLDRALDMDAKDMKARLARAEFFKKSGDWAAAETDLTAAISLAPMRADLYRLRAQVRTLLHRTEGAQEDEKTANELD